jgi:hypothetical protein
MHKQSSAAVPQTFAQSNKYTADLLTQFYFIDFPAVLCVVYVFKKEKFFLHVIKFPSEMHPAVNDYRKLFNQSTCCCWYKQKKVSLDNTQDECLVYIVDYHLNILIQTN